MKIDEKTTADGGAITEKNLKKALIKCATGLSASEVVEEFAAVDGELKLVKKKVTKRQIPPDIKAVKLLMDGGSEEPPSDEELEEERKKLIDMLRENKDG